MLEHQSRRQWKIRTERRRIKESVHWSGVNPISTFIIFGWTYHWFRQLKCFEHNLNSKKTKSGRSYSNYFSALTFHKNFEAIRPASCLMRWKFSIWWRARKRLLKIRGPKSSTLEKSTSFGPFSGDNWQRPRKNRAFQ